MVRKWTAKYFADVLNLKIERLINNNSLFVNQIDCECTLIVPPPVYLKLNKILLNFLRELGEKNFRIIDIGKYIILSTKMSLKESA